MKSVPRTASVLVAVTAGALTGCVVADYLQAEENGRRLRFEGAQIESAQPASATVDVAVLTQLREFYRFARTRADRNMPPEQLIWMRQIAERYGFPSTLFRYAVAAALNGQPSQARQAMIVLCRIHPTERCVEGRDAWAALTVQYPELKTIAWPEIRGHASLSLPVHDKSMPAR